jgi:hypothetical protein
MLIKPASAQLAPKPSVPEFTLKFVDYSYDIPSRTSVDPYTGKTISYPADRVINYTAQISIKNQPFTPKFYPDTNTSLFYNIQAKGHYTNTWTEVYTSDTFINTPGNQNYTQYNYPAQSNSEYTILSIPYNYPIDGTVDFRVQAIIANVTGMLVSDLSPDFGWIYRYSSDIPYSYHIAWTSLHPSEWSTIQTINLSNGSPSVSTQSATPNPTPTPSVPEFPRLMILPLFIFMLSIAVTVKFRKTWKTIQH